jgi:hypothetical protein
MIGASTDPRRDLGASALRLVTRGVLPVLARVIPVRIDKSSDQKPNLPLR